MGNTCCHKPDEEPVLKTLENDKKIDDKIYINGIPEDEFENLIMEYLPITAEQIKEYSEYDSETHTYKWSPLGCINYTPTFFSTSIPEVTNIRKNEDGTITLTVDALCNMVVCDDALITHELTVKFNDDGSFKYISNKILDNGIDKIPIYQYRIK